MKSRRNLKHLTKLKIKHSTRVILIFISLIVFAFSSASFYKSLFDKTTKVEEDIYTYQNEYNANYNVNIKENPFISGNVLPSGKTYISDLVNSFDVKLDYKYTGSKPATIDYNYKIDAVIGASYQYNGKEYSVWNKTDNLKNVETKQSKDSISIKEEVNIDFAKYNEQVKNFKQTLGMSVNANLYVRLTVNTRTFINNEEVINQYVSNFAISLGDKITMVNGKSNDIQIGSTKYSSTTENMNINFGKLIISLIGMIISIYTMYFIQFKTKKLNTIKNEFKLELNRILKSCQDRIVIVKNKVDADEENIIEVNDFGELIKLSEELYKPILCWVSDDINNEEAWFSVLSNKVGYRFILKK